FSEAAARFERGERGSGEGAFFHARNRMAIRAARSSGEGSTFACVTSHPRGFSLRRAVKIGRARPGLLVRETEIWHPYEWRMQRRKLQKFDQRNLIELRADVRKRDSRVRVLSREVRRCVARNACEAREKSATVFGRFCERLVVRRFPERTDVSRD